MIIDDDYKGNTVTKGSLAPTALPAMNALLDNDVPGSLCLTTGKATRLPLPFEEPVRRLLESAQCLSVDESGQLLVHDALHLPAFASDNCVMILVGDPCQLPAYSHVQNVPTSMAKLMQRWPSHCLKEQYRSVSGWR